MRPVGKRFEPCRVRSDLKVVPKYVIVTEGYRTEQIYFDALSENRTVAGISALVDIVLLQREPADSGLSHPLVLLELLEKYMECVRAGRYSVDLVLEVVCNEIWVSKGISGADARMEAYRSAARDAVGESADGVADIVDACRGIAERMFGFRPVVDLPELLDYRPDVDRVCVIVDRDADNRGAVGHRRLRQGVQEPWLHSVRDQSLLRALAHDALRGIRQRGQGDAPAEPHGRRQEVHRGGAGPHRA